MPGRSVLSVRHTEFGGYGALGQRITNGTMTGRLSVIHGNLGKIFPDGFDRLVEVDLSEFWLVERQAGNDSKGF